MENLSVLNRNIIAAYQKKDYNQCLDLLKKSLELCPSFVPHKILQAECWTALKINDEQVLESFKGVIEQDPKCAIAYYGIGHAYYCQGDMWQAVEFLDKAIGLKMTNDMQKAVELKQKAKNIMEAICDANVKFEMNNIEKAMKILSMAASIDPANEKVQKKIREIKEFFIKDLVERLETEVTPDVSDTWTKLELKSKLEKAETLINEEKIEEAMVVMKEISEIDSSSDQLAFLKAFAQYMDGSMKPAIELFNETLKLNSSHQRAKELLEKATKINELFEKATQLTVEKMHDDAIEIFTNILSIDGKNMKVIQAALFQRSLGNFKLGSTTQAFKDFKLFEATKSKNGFSLTDLKFE